MRTANLSLLSYGDFIIDYYFARYSANDQFLVAACHHKPLYDCLQPISNMVFIDTFADSVPLPLWDLKRPQRALPYFSKLQKLRSSLDAVLSGFDNIYLPTKHKRWGLVVDLSKCSYVFDYGSNIYLGYSRLTQVHLPLDSCLDISESACCTIFPNASSPSKTLSIEHIKKVISVNRSYGIDTRIVYVEEPGSRIFHKSDIDENVHITSVWGFSALVKEIAASGYVVCADSLPSHLSYLLGKTSFVFYNQPLYHMMPPPQLVRQQWGSLSEISSYSHFIESLGRSLRPLF